MIVSYLTDVVETNNLLGIIESKIHDVSSDKLQEITLGIGKGCNYKDNPKYRYFILTTLKEIIIHKDKGNPYLWDYSQECLKNKIK